MTARVSRRRRPAGLALLATGLAVLAVTLGGTSARGAVPLGTATSFAVLANTTITNTGATTINGDVGLYPGTGVTGFGTVTLNGDLHVTDAVAQQALLDAGTAYRSLQSRTPCTDLTGRVLGQDVGTAADPLLPGVYCFSSSAQVTGDLYLSGGGEYVFRIGSTLTTASGSRVILQNGADACNVFWAVGSSATLGTNSHIVGTIIANVSITANTGAVVEGRLFALTGAVTLDANVIGGMNCPPRTTTTTAPTTTTTGPTITTTTGPTTTTTTGPTTTTTTGPTTTTTTPGATTTTAPGGTTTTAPPGATTTTIGSGGPTTTLVPATTTTTPTATTAATTTTTTTVGSGSTGGNQGSPGLTTTTGPSATPAAPGPLLSPSEPALRIQNLPRTGQGLNGPLSAAVVSIFLGALLLLAPRRGGVSAMAFPQLSGAGPTPADLHYPLRPMSAKISAPTAVESSLGRGKTAPEAAQPTPAVTQPQQAVGLVGTRAPGPGDLVGALERQLQEADARLARMRTMR